MGTLARTDVPQRTTVDWVVLYGSCLAMIITAAIARPLMRAASNGSIDIDPVAYGVKTRIKPINPSEEDHLFVEAKLSPASSQPKKNIPIVIPA